MDFRFQVIGTPFHSMLYSIDVMNEVEARNCLFCALHMAYSFKWYCLLTTIQSLFINYYFVDSIIHIIFDLPWCQILFIRFLSSLMDKKWIHGRSYGCGSIPGHRCCCAETSSVQFGGRGPPSSLLGPFNQETARWIVTAQEETTVTKRQWEDLVNWRWSHNAANTTNCSGRI